MVDPIKVVDKKLRINNRLRMGQTAAMSGDDMSVSESRNRVEMSMRRAPEFKEQ